MEEDLAVSLPRDLFFRFFSFFFAWNLKITQIGNSENGLGNFQFFLKMLIETFTLDEVIAVNKKNTKNHTHILTI